MECLNVVLFLIGMGIRLGEMGLVLNSGALISSIIFCLCNELLLPSLAEFLLNLESR